MPGNKSSVYDIVSINSMIHFDGMASFRNWNKSASHMNNMNAVFVVPYDIVSQIDQITAIHENNKQ